MAINSCRWLSSESGRSQPGSLIKSEMTKISERRLIELRAAVRSGEWVGHTGKQITDVYEKNRMGIHNQGHYLSVSSPQAIAHWIGAAPR